MAKHDPFDVPLVGEIGQSGLKRTSGYIQEEFLNELRGIRGVNTYKEMGDNDPVCGAILFAIQMLIRQVPWRVEAYSEEPEDMDAAEFLDSCLHDMDESWNNIVVEILSMLQYGWSYHETVYKVRAGNSEDKRFRSRYADGKVGWRKLPIRSQDSLQSWEYSSANDDTLIGMIQSPAPSYRNIFLPIEKCLLFRPMSHKDNPEGRSILRNAYSPWYFKKNIERIEAIGIERDLAGLPVIRVPPQLFDSSAGEDASRAFEAYKNIVRNLKRDEQEGIILPSAFDQNGNRLYDIELLASGGSRQMNTEAIVQRYDRRIAMTALADFLFIGHQNTGSFALIDNKTDLFVTAIGSWLDAIAGVFNRVAIPRLWKMNGWKLERMPVLTHGDIESPDLGKLGTYVSQLAGSGVNLFPNKKLENWLKRQGGMPVDETIDEESEEVGQVAEGNQGQTSQSGEPMHFHEYIVDDQGNGLTRATSAGPDHVHTILNGNVQQAGNIPHTHALR